MRISAAWLGLLLAMLAGAAFAQGCPASGTSIPALTGRMVYEDANGGQIYVYDFLCATTATMPQRVKIETLTVTSTGLTGVGSPTNPVFSPDGQAVVFRAVQNDESHIYYWAIGSGTLTNLTGFMGNQNNQDVKFSADGFSMVWKQLSGVEVASFTLDDTGTPQLSQVRQLTAGTRGASSEASGPTFSPDGQHVYYFTGSACAQPMQIQQISVNSPAGRTNAFSGQAAGTYFYYPAIDYSTDKFFYVTGPIQPAGPGCSANPQVLPPHGPDRLFYYPNANTITGAATEFDASETTVDKSDPAPIDGDYFIYSKDPSGPYGLYLGQLSTGQSWSLAPLNVNISGGSMVGANYTAIRPLAPTTFGLGGPNYHTAPGTRCRKNC